MVRQIAKSEAMQHAGKLYDFAFQSFKSNAFAFAIPQLQATIEVGDPLYLASALWLLALTYRRLKDRENERDVLSKILSLPPETRRFVGPEELGIAHMRLGDANAAAVQYSLAIRFNGETPARLANLAEALLVKGDYGLCLTISDKLVSHPEPQLLIIGRIFKGAALWFTGQKKDALAEFQFVGSYLVSVGGIPPNLTWDFGDSERVLNRVESPVAESVLKVLRGKIDFATFRQGWVGTAVAT